MPRPASPFARRARRQIAGVVLLLVAGHVLAAHAGERREVKDPHYGEVLFYFYQQKYFTALSHLMTAQHFARVPRHADEAELLRGGLLLSYGLHVEAGQIFERLIEAGAPPPVRDRAWFYLAKIRYQRGYLAEAEEALARVGGPLPGDLDDERQVLHATLLMQRGRFREAAERLAGLKAGSGWAPYGRYNLGVALVRGGQTEEGLALLERLGHEPARSEELKALRDKANVALGFTLLQAGQAERARVALERVRLKGLLSNKALLGMGWVHSALDRQERALVAWDELQGRDVLDGAVQESMLAVPYALGKLGAFRQSLERYEQAIEVFTREMARLDAAIAAVRAGRLSAGLVGEAPVEEMGWLWQLEQLPDAPEFHYLATLLAGHDFQEALKNYRDLRFLQARLAQWTDDVGVYGDMLATRRTGFNERLPALLSSPRMQGHVRLAAERERAAAELARIEREADAQALASDKERAQLARLERIRFRLSRRVTDDESWERYRLLSGLLRWDIDTDYAARLWQARKSLRELDAALAENEQRRAALARGREEEPRGFDAFDARIQALNPRIAGLAARAAGLARAQETHLAELAVAELGAQRERLATYLTQARFAVAQIYDRSSGESPGPPTGTP